MAITVILPYDPQWNALRWAKDNCPGYITNKAIINWSATGDPDSDYDVAYYFSNEEDAIAFTLKWI